MRIQLPLFAGGAWPVRQKQAPSKQSTPVTSNAITGRKPLTSDTLSLRHTSLHFGASQGGGIAIDYSAGAYAAGAPGGDDGEDRRPQKPIGKGKLSNRATTARKSTTPGYEAVDATEDTDNEIANAKATGQPQSQWPKEAVRALDRLRQRKRQLNPKAKQVQQTYKDSGRLAKVQQAYKDSGRQAKVQQAYKDSGRRAEVKQTYKDSGRQAEVDQAYYEREKAYTLGVLSVLEGLNPDLEGVSAESLQKARQTVTGKTGSKYAAKLVLDGRIKKKSKSGSQASSSTRGISQQLTHSHIQTPQTQEEADDMVQMGRELMAAGINWQDRQDEPPARPETPPNSWSENAYRFRNPNGTYADTDNPQDPSHYPGFQGYDNGRPVFAIYGPDGETVMGYSHTPQLRGG